MEKNTYNTVKIYISTLGYQMVLQKNTGITTWPFVDFFSPSTPVVTYCILTMILSLQASQIMEKHVRLFFNKTWGEQL